MSHKILAGGICVLLLAWGGSGVFGAARHAPGDASSPAAGASASRSQDDWQEFTSEAGRFRMRGPGTPVEHVMRGIGEEEMHLFYYLGDEAHLYLYYGDVPPEGNVDLDSLREIILNGLPMEPATLQSEHDISLGGIPGRECVAQMGEPTERLGRARFRLFVVGSRVYNVMATSPADVDEPEFVDAFLDSFEFWMPEDEAGEAAGAAGAGSAMTPSQIGYAAGYLMGRILASLVLAWIGVTVWASRREGRKATPGKILLMAIILFVLSLLPAFSGD